MTDNILIRRKDETHFDYKVRLCVAKLNKEIDLDWSEIVNLLGLECSSDHLRKLSYAYKEVYENTLNVPFSSENVDAEEYYQSKYKETTEIQKDGQQKSDKLIKMTSEESKNEHFLLDAHGYDRDEWEIVNAKSSVWNQHNKTDGTITLYSSKITVKPKKNGFNIDKLVEVMSKRDPIIVDEIKDKTHSKLLEIPLYDMHFGVSNLDDYKSHLDEIIHKIRSRYWDKILFVIGQDLLHNDNFKGQTANGTLIEKVDMEQAFNDALTFYETLFEEALIYSDLNVEAIYVKGNHDESIAYGLFRTLQATFPQVKFDSRLKQRKSFVWEKVFLGLTHGDKGANRMMENFMTDFGKLIAHAEVREIHSGHLHAEITKDKFGLVQRTLATANKTDDWHEDQGFVGANKRFQLFEYSPSSLDAIYYI